MLEEQLSDLGTLSLGVGWNPHVYPGMHTTALEEHVYSPSSIIHYFALKSIHRQDNPTLSYS